MSADASVRANEDSAEEERDGRRGEYEELEEVLDVVIEAGLYKIDGAGRITDAKKEQARSKWCNTVIQAIREKRKIIHDRDLEELRGEVEVLKAERGESE